MDQHNQTKHSKIAVGDISIESWQLEANELAALLLELLEHKLVGEYLGYRNTTAAVRGAAYTG